MTLLLKNTHYKNLAQLLLHFYYFDSHIYDFESAFRSKFNKYIYSYQKYNYNQKRYLEILIAIRKKKTD